MVHVSAFMRAQFGHLVPGRDVMLGKAHCPLAQRFLDDAHTIGDVLEAAARVRVPWLLVHGDADELVPLQDARDALAVASDARLVTLAGVDHRFGGHEAEMAAAVGEWLQSLR
jgi:pimeloyl-ACP methyl ester carboxylesterase